jgi:signal peptidase II
VLIVKRKLQKVDNLHHGMRNAVFFITAFLVLIADQSVKIWIRTYPEGVIISKAGFFRIIHIYNTGAAFGIFPDQKLPLIIVASVCIISLLIFIFLYSHKLPVLNNKLGMMALGLIFGGIAGNLIDRVRLGHVTDFIDVSFWPTFNIADSSLTIGVIMLIIILLLPEKTGGNIPTEQNEQCEEQ